MACLSIWSHWKAKTGETAVRYDRQRTPLTVLQCHLHSCFCSLLRGAEHYLRAERYTEGTERAEKRQQRHSKTTSNDSPADCFSSYEAMKVLLTTGWSRDCRFLLGLADNKLCTIYHHLQPSLLATFVPDNHQAKLLLHVFDIKLTHDIASFHGSLGNAFLALCPSEKAPGGIVPPRYGCTQSRFWNLILLISHMLLHGQEMESLGIIYASLLFFLFFRSCSTELERQAAISQVSSKEMFNVVWRSSAGREALQAEELHHFWKTTINKGSKVED